jgi:dCTP diphosphatase
LVCHWFFRETPKSSVSSDAINDGEMMNIKEIQEKLEAFATERDWAQFHSPKNLSMALAGEVGELLEIFQWMTEEQSKNLTDVDKRKVSEELADIMIYLLKLADKTGIDINQSVIDKIEINARKYPIEKAKGSAKKYTELDS